MVYNNVELAMRLQECEIPYHMHHSVIEYILEGRPVGHFLTAIFSNDLAEACMRADEENQRRIYEYFKFLYNFAPAGCWGSPEKYTRWVEHRGMRFLEPAEVSPIKEEFVSIKILNEN